MTLPYERTRAIKQLLDFRRKISLMTTTDIRKQAWALRDEARQIGRHVCSSDIFDFYYEEKDGDKRQPIRQENTKATDGLASGNAQPASNAGLAD